MPRSDHREGIRTVELSLGVKVLLLVTCTLFSMLVAIGAGWLSHKPGARKRDGVLVGGCTFGSSLTLCLLVLTSLGVL
ncbi:hypothetical protein GA0115245_145810 [Streptomyces sp. di188]|nr:hypothetical protein GA0115238_105810 [Streptomyces sp. di50b]SCE52914.1 hypothetical protein GA0115245_145810 [Streptomyces sp. di188]